jgi:hypothetical protein
MTDVLKTTDSDLSPRPGGMSFDEFFGLAQPVAPRPVGPTAVKWIRAFADNTAIVMRIRDIPRVEAERVAFANTVTQYLDANWLNTDPTSCAHCGSSERPNDLRPMGGGIPHSWVHSDCWSDWTKSRRADAVRALAEMGVVQPIEPQPKGEEPCLTKPS